MFVTQGTFRPFLRSIFNKEEAQLILVLGGDIDREKAGFKMAKKLNLPIIISGGSNPEYSEWLAEKEGLPSKLIRRDYRAQDTLGNFTSLVNDLSSDNINHIFLITSEDHIDRAIIVGKIIAGSRGIKLKSISIPCAHKCKKESQKKYYIDIIRSITWVVTGKDLKNILPEKLKAEFVE
ncbi:MULTISPECIES: YdcF family protein [Prochlorococcus]|uniref:YdcF family protein n=1 Tax=Prochlorococcus TaxID=1218 RepID=UPI001F4D1699|nr:MULTISPECIES: YdcF family protein [Prochlorococcus]